MRQLCAQAALGTHSCTHCILHARLWLGGVWGNRRGPGLPCRPSVHRKKVAHVGVCMGQRDIPCGQANTVMVMVAVAFSLGVPRSSTRTDSAKIGFVSKSSGTDELTVRSPLAGLMAKARLELPPAEDMPSDS